MRAARLELIRPRDVGDFEERAGAFLAAREAEHCLMLGLCADMRVTTSRTERYFAVVAVGAEVVGAALQWGRNVVLSAIDDERVIPLVAADVLSVSQHVPGVLGRKAESRHFAELWSQRTGRPSRLHMSERVFQLTRVRSPGPVAGALRRAGPQDRELLIGWMRAFTKEALGEEHGPDEMGPFIDRWLEGRGRTMYVWEDDRPVSITGVSGRTPRGIRVAPVYTPPELRGRGYASACVAAVSQAQLDAGRTFCFLFTDLANPTSNRIYQRIGYEPVCDMDDHRFGEAPTA